MKLSIIIPIYNVEDTLRRCLESVLGQMDDRMEVIIVDDGSTDTSGLTAGLSARPTRDSLQQETQE